MRYSGRVWESRKVQGLPGDDLNGTNPQLAGVLPEHTPQRFSKAQILSIVHRLRNEIAAQHSMTMGSQVKL